MKQITVFTPTYNRIYILPEAYKSLAQQTNKNFTWLIVDDGSIDGTKEIVEKWIGENQIDIQYVWKPNGGMHTAHNKALEMVSTELCFCLDSDDDLKPNAIEVILDFWKGYPFKDRAIGLVMNETYRNSGQIIGTPFPAHLKEISYQDIYYKYGLKGDKLLVYKSDVFKEFPYPVFEGERFVSLDYKYIRYHGPLAILNDSVYLKEYLLEGHSKNLRKIYARNPRGYAFYHKFRMENIPNFMPSVKSAIHYTACMLLAKQRPVVSGVPKPLLSILTFPFGFFWYLVLKRTRARLGPMHESVH